MLNGPTDRTVLPISKLPSQLGGHPRQPPLPNVQSGLPSGEMRLDSGLCRSPSFGNNPPSHRHLPSVPHKRGQLVPSSHQRRKLRDSPSRLSKPFPSSGKLPGQSGNPLPTTGNDLSSPVLQPLKLLDPLLVRPLLPCLINQPSQRPGNLPQAPSPPPTRTRRGTTGTRVATTSPAAGAFSTTDTPSATVRDATVCVATRVATRVAAARAASARAATVCVVAARVVAARVAIVCVAARVVAARVATVCAAAARVAAACVATRVAAACATDTCATDIRVAVARVAAACATDTPATDIRVAAACVAAARVATVSVRA